MIYRILVLWVILCLSSLVLHMATYLWVILYICLLLDSIFFFTCLLVNILINHFFLFFCTNRTSAETHLNANSSRSHSILLVKVIKTELQTLKQCHMSKVFLVDLAGSEDNHNTGNEGTRWVISLLIKNHYSFNFVSLSIKCHYGN